jgi:addiction module HigA family antidote
VHNLNDMTIKTWASDETRAVFEGESPDIVPRRTTMAKRAPIHPGYILETEFLDELGLSAYALAKALRVPVNRITGIIKGERAITADTALRLARFFGTTPEFWLNLQSHYDLTVASRRDAQRIEREVPRMAANG